MGLFQKNPHSSHEHHSLYTSGLNKTLLIAGLGNTGKSYKGTRHNVGFEAIDAFQEAAGLPKWTNKKDLKCHLTHGTMGDSRVILIKPTTFMNESGRAVQAAAHFYKVPVEQILVVHDELDIPFGQIRTRKGGSDAGNNGIKSVIENLGNNFGRIRIGIKATSPMNSADFVLAPFSKAEQKHWPALIKEANSILSEYVYSGGALTHETRSFII
jgi:peptidyl-tRNA hydrolase, PTH1 family